jgi:hypothetical protein
MTSETTSWMCRQWKDEHAETPNICTFENWIEDAVHNHPMDLNDADDIEMVVMCSKPSQSAHDTRG